MNLPQALADPSVPTPRQLSDQQRPIADMLRAGHPQESKLGRSQLGAHIIDDALLNRFDEYDHVMMRRERLCERERKAVAPNLPNVRHDDRDSHRTPGTRRAVKLKPLRQTFERAGADCD